MNIILFGVLTSRVYGGVDFCSKSVLKLSRYKKDLNDVKAAPFLVSSAKKTHRKRGSCDIIKVLLIM